MKGNAVCTRLHLNQNNSLAIPQKRQSPAKAGQSVGLEKLGFENDPFHRIIKNVIHPLN